jgi:peptidoglycan/xylan/chitin deacetylase (PgdA/CDA1 family)
MKGTFFIISSFVTAESWPHLVEAVRNGHQLGNHGHNNLPQGLMFRNNLKYELETCDDLIKRIYDAANVPLSRKFYRPHMAIFHPMMLNLVAELGYTLTLGSVYPHDPMVSCPALNLWFIKYKLEQGDIVILHDRDWTPPLLEELCKYLTSIQLPSVTLDTLTAQ